MSGKSQRGGILSGVRPATVEYFRALISAMTMQAITKGAKIFNSRRSNSNQNGAALTLSGRFPAPPTPFVPLGKSVFTRGQKKTFRGRA